MTDKEEGVDGQKGFREKNDAEVESRAFFNFFTLKLNEPTNCFGLWLTAHSALLGTANAFMYSPNLLLGGHPGWGTDPCAKAPPTPIC